jgi:hypothetical protein
MPVAPIFTIEILGPSGPACCWEVGNSPEITGQLIFSQNDGLYHSYHFLTFPPMRLLIQYSYHVTTLLSVFKGNIEHGITNHEYRSRRKMPYFSVFKL